MHTEHEFVKLDDFLGNIDTVRFELTPENVKAFNDVFGGDTVRRLWIEPKDKTVFNSVDYGPNVVIVLYDNDREHLFKINGDTLLVRSFSINGTELTFTIVDNSHIVITNCSTIETVEYVDIGFGTIPIPVVYGSRRMSPVVKAMNTIGIKDVSIAK